MSNAISGIILAGGRNSRMGSPKSFLSVKGRRIIDITLEVFHSLFEEILIVTDDKSLFVEFKDVKITGDLVRGCGPLGGIYTGLKTTSKDKAFFVACDMPFLHIGFINKLLDISTKDNSSSIIPYSDKGPEPLHAIYPKSILLNLEASLNRKEFSVRQFLRHCNCKYISADKDKLSSFFNINSREDLKEMESHESKI